MRFGDSPATYRWEVTAKDGTRRYYGWAPGDAASAPATIGAHNGRARWYLRSIVDTFGNRVRFDYDLIGGAGQYEERTLVLSAIHYTLDEAANTGAYQVHMCRDPQQRPDPLLNARGGYLDRLNTRLSRVEVYFQRPNAVSPCSGTASPSLIRAWDLA